MSVRRIIWLFLDGVGLGSADPAVNPLRNGFPGLEAMLGTHSVPVDACLGVPGLPQSATGQTALLTGVNAARLLGRHAEGFPGAALRPTIEEHNVFAALSRRGLRSTFANAYYVDTAEEVRRWRVQSVTTVAALSAFGTVRDRVALEADEAVYHDLTRRSLRDRGYAGPLVSPEEAARHLLALAQSHALTLFEYFLTDRAGHAGDRALAESVLGELDAFVGVLLERARKEGPLLVLTSDHGNIEDVTTPSHTANPVPFAAAGQGAERLLAGARSITDVVPAILRCLG